MAQLNLTGLTPLQLGRVNKALDQLGRYGGEVRTLRQHLETLRGEKKIYDGMCDWNRTKFNRMNYLEQREYEARLKARRHYTVDGWHVPKIVFDIVIGS